MALNGRKPKQGANIRRAMESPLVRRLGDIHFRPQEPRRTLYKLIGELQEGRYVLAMAGHAFAVVDGKIHDKIVLPPGVRVKAIWKVTPAKVEDSVTNIPAPVLS
jgi:hypothetical protein